MDAYPRLHSGVLRSPRYLNLVWPARRLATLFSGGKITVVMARPLDEIVRLDRLWFWAHPERSHRCRWPDTRELALCNSDRGVPLVIAIRHLGRGHVLYQPVIFHGVLPNDERSAEILFALAARCPEPVPLVSEIDMLRLQRGVPRQPTANAGGGARSHSSAGGLEKGRGSRRNLPRAHGS
jgi:hypothetical protein